MFDHWNPSPSRRGEDALLVRYLEAVGGLIFTEVPILGKGFRGAGRRRLDGVRIASDAPAELIAWSRSTAPAIGDAIRGADVEVIEVKRRGLTRPVLGQVVAGMDLLAMEYGPAQVRGTAVCREGDPLLEAICDHWSIKVWALGRPRARARARSGPSGVRRIQEDVLLHRYWQAAGGTLFTRVPIGVRGPAGSLPLSADGVRITSGALPTQIVPYSGAVARDFEMAVNGAAVELIEVNRKLNRAVFGQALFGPDLLRLDCAPAAIHRVIVCSISDPLLERICARRDISVWRAPAS